MPRTTFDKLPPTARLWIFAADRELPAPEADRLLTAVDRFLEEWTAHRQHLMAARDWRHARFLLVGVDESTAGVSGCSIDALVREIKQLEQAMGVTLADSGSSGRAQPSSASRASDSWSWPRPASSARRPPCSTTRLPRSTTCVRVAGSCPRVRRGTGERSFDPRQRPHVAGRCRGGCAMRLGV